MHGFVSLTLLFLTVTAAYAFEIDVQGIAISPPGKQRWRLDTSDPTCHPTRTLRVKNEGWGDPETYRMADQITDLIWVGSVSAAICDNGFVLNNNIGLAISMARGEYLTMPGIRILSNGQTADYEYYGLEDWIYEDRIFVKKTLDEVATRVISYVHEQRLLPESERRGVLIFCNMGISRSVTATLYTLMLMNEDQVPPRESFAHYYNKIKERRPVARPNRLYLSILEEEIQERKEEL